MAELGPKDRTGFGFVCLGFLITDQCSMENFKWILLYYNSKLETSRSAGAQALSNKMHFISKSQPQVLDVRGTLSQGTTTPNTAWQPAEHAISWNVPGHTASKLRLLTATETSTATSKVEEYKFLPCWLWNMALQPFV